MLNLVPALFTVQRLYALILLMFHRKVKKQIQIFLLKKKEENQVE